MILATGRSGLSIMRGSLRKVATQKTSGQNARNYSGCQYCSVLTSRWRGRSELDVDGKLDTGFHDLQINMPRATKQPDPQSPTSSSTLIAATSPNVLKRYQVTSPDHTV